MFKKAGPMQFEIFCIYSGLSVSVALTCFYWLACIDMRTFFYAGLQLRGLSQISQYLLWIDRDIATDTFRV